MPLVINTNVPSLNAQRQLVQSGNDMAQAMERLSSGKRINTAADDAAGLAISNRQTSQIRGLNQAIRNANDGVSLIQTAEGALDETTNILQRMRELSIQSANGIYADRDRGTLDAEVQQLKAEIDRIASSTTFNGQPLLDGSLSDVELQVGSEAFQTIDLEIQGFSAASLGGASGDIVGQSAVNGIADFTTVFTATGDIQVNDVDITAIGAGLTLNENLASINADLDGKGAEVSALVNTTGNDVGDGLLVAGTDSVTLTVVDGDGNTQSYVLTDTQGLDELVEKINNETAVSASIDEETGKTVLSQENVVSIAVTGAGGGLAAIGFDGTEADDNFRLVFNDTSADDAGVKIEIAANTTAAELADLGLEAQDDDGNLLGQVITGTAGLNEGDLIINGVEIPAFNGNATAATQITNALSAINSVSADTGVIGYVGATTGQIELASVSGEEISIEAGVGTTPALLEANVGFQERNSVSGAGSVAGIDISTATGAQRAIDVIDEALEQINETRSDLGAINNRLEFTMSNLSNVSEKTSAARSRIVDADFAAETSQLSRAQVLQQASQAMLAQANAQPQQVLSLLQG